MAQVTLELGVPTQQSAGNWVQWDERTQGFGDLSVFSADGSARHLIRLRLFRAARVQFQVIDTPDGSSGFSSAEELTAAWEEHSPAITVRASGVADLEIPGPRSADSLSMDSTEPYQWSAGDHAAWFDAYEDAGRPAASIVVSDSDAVEVALAGFAEVGIEARGAISQAAIRSRLKLGNYWIEAELSSGVWADLSGDIIGAIAFDAGLEGSGPLDRVAKVGTLSFSLDARDGRYNPRRSTVLAGWQWGVALRLRVEAPDGSQKTRWSGALATVDPTSGLYGDRLVHCTAVDWMEHGAILVRPPIQIGETGGVVLQAIVDELPVAERPATDFDAGSEGYAYALYDSKDGTAIRTLFQRVAICEGGIIYVSGGGELRFRGRLDFGDVAYTFTDEHIPDGGIEVPDDLADVYTRAEVKVHPLRIDSARRALYTLGDSGVLVKAGSTVTLFAEFRNPDTETQTVGAVDLGGHTFEARANEDGTGADRSSDITLTVEGSGGAAQVSLENGGATDAYVTALEIMGKGVYDLQPLVVVSEASTVRYPKTLRYEMPYQGSVDLGEFFGEFLLGVYGVTDYRVRSLAVEGRGTEYACDALAKIEIGDTIEVMEAQTGVSQQARVLGYSMTIFPELTIVGTLVVGPPLLSSDGTWTWDVSEWDGEDVWG